MSGRKSNGHGVVYCKFYFRDWMAEPSLRRLGPEHRGVWIDIICLMAQGEKYGYLETNGKAWPIEELSRCLGVARDLLEQMLKQMEAVGVFSRDDRGVIYSRRMLRDIELYEKRALSGSIGGKAAHLSEKKEESIAKAIATKRSSTCSSICSSKTQGYDGKLPDNGRSIDGRDNPPTLADCQSAAASIGMPAAMVEAFFHHYNAQGWVTGNGRRITSLASALAKWKANQSNHQPKAKAGQPDTSQYKDFDQQMREQGLKV